MYSKIVNPKTGRKVSTKSKLGQNILRKYINSLYYINKGGTPPTPTTGFPSPSLASAMPSTTPNQWAAAQQAPRTRVPLGFGPAPAPTTPTTGLPSPFAAPAPPTTGFPSPIAPSIPTGASKPVLIKDFLPIMDNEWPNGPHGPGSSIPWTSLEKIHALSKTHRWSGRFGDLTIAHFKTDPHSVFMIYGFGGSVRAPRATLLSAEQDLKNHIINSGF